MKILTPLSMVASLVVAGAAAAQSTDQATPPAAPNQAAQPAVAQADTTAPVPPAASDAAGNAAGNTPAIPEQTQTPASGATTVNATVTNGPIPDTPANRAKYGAPMSHAGRKTAPAGN
jgi:hypothetical protein